MQSLMAGASKRDISCVAEDRDVQLSLFEYILLIALLFRRYNCNILDFPHERHYVESIAY
jgi:hypothetical protein